MLGTMMITSPVGYITQYLNYIPLLGGILSGLINLGLFLAGLTVSIMGSLLVIGTSWLFHRPLLAIGLLGTMVAVMVGTYVLQGKMGASKRAAAAGYDGARDAGAGAAEGAGAGGPKGGPVPDYRNPAAAAATARATGGHLD